MKKENLLARAQQLEKSAQQNLKALDSDMFEKGSSFEDALNTSAMTERLTATIIRSICKMENITLRDIENVLIEVREIIEQEKAKDVICSCRKIEKGADA